MNFANNIFCKNVLIEKHYLGITREIIIRSTYIRTASWYYNMEGKIFKVRDFFDIDDCCKYLCLDSFGEIQKEHIMKYNFLVLEDEGRRTGRTINIGDCDVIK